MHQIKQQIITNYSFLCPSILIAFLELLSLQAA